MSRFSPVAALLASCLSSCATAVESECAALEACGQLENSQITQEKCISRMNAYRSRALALPECAALVEATDNWMYCAADLPCEIRTITDNPLPCPTENEAVGAARAAHKDCRVPLWP